MKIKTAALIGPALDWAVATCDGFEYDTESGLLYKHKEPHFFKRYSTDWAQGGPIIEREGISLLYLYVADEPLRWIAAPKPTIKKVKPKGMYGPTLLIAAMRCFVTIRLGEKVDVPEELL